MQLLLYSVFRIGNATANVTWQSYQDIAARLAEIAAAVVPERIAEWVEAISGLREQLRQNVNRQLALESILLSQRHGQSAPL